MQLELARESTAQPLVSVIGDGAGVEAHLGARADDLEHGGLQGEGEAKARRDEERAQDGVSGGWL